MNKNYLKVPAEYLWILNKKTKGLLLSELERRAEILE
jgi:hypothetical protein